MRRSFGAGARWAAQESQVRSPGGCQSVRSRSRPQKQQIFPASRFRVVEDRSPPILNNKRIKDERYQQVKIIPLTHMDALSQSDYAVTGQFSGL
jgi:hypothetical protein